MNLAFAIVNLFPGGGLQRDCIALARMVRDRGHSVTVFAARMHGNVAADLDVEILPNQAWTNHGRNRQFANSLAKRSAGRFDRIVGFNKLPGLDMLYCADPSIAAELKGSILRWLPRGQTMMALEKACFAPGERTRLLLLSKPQIEGYRNVWQTEPERISLLPPNIRKERRQPQHRTDGTRERVRASCGIAADRWLWLTIGLQPHVKGMDRVVHALAAHPEATLLIAGLSEYSPRGKRVRRRAGRHGVGDRIRLLGIRDEIPQLMAAADLLVHPARTETTGTVILEAVINGLPVVTTAVCGYADHVKAAEAGVVVSEPFRPEQFTAAIGEAQDTGRRALWSANGARYGDNPGLYRGLDDAAAMILQ